MSMRARLARWRRAKECHRKYGDACPHLERHSRRWIKPSLGTGVPSPRRSFEDAAGEAKKDEPAVKGD